MKITKRFLILTLLTTPILYADEKITQMIYAENQYNPYKNEKGILNNTVIYYLSDNQLYMQDITDPLQPTDHQIDIYQFKDKEKQNKWEKNDKYFDSSNLYKQDFEKINNANIMRIGKPAMVKINANKCWAMPLVRKTRWFSGNFLRGSGNLFKTDLCVLERKKVLEDSKSRISPSTNTKTIYLLRKVGEGHRTVTNFVGLQHVSDTMLVPQDCQKLSEKGWAILSSSTWPTIKWTFLDTRTAVEWKDKSYYVLDGEPEKKDYFLVLSKLINRDNMYGIGHLFCINKFNQTWNVKWIDSKGAYLSFVDFVSYLPAIRISPAFFVKIFDKDFHIQEQIRSAFAKIVKIEETVENNWPFIRPFEQLQVYLTPNNEPIIIAENRLYRNITSINKENNFKQVLDKEKNDMFITASSFDFDNNRLIFGLYNEKNKKQSIKIIQLDKNVKSLEE